MFGKPSVSKLEKYSAFKVSIINPRPSEDVERETQTISPFQEF